MDECMDECIHEKIISGEISALTLDTSIFDRAGLAMESGLLAQLSQFRDGDIRLVIARVVANEVRRHLADNAEKAASTLQNALRDIGRHRVLPFSTLKQFQEVVEGIRLDIRSRASKRFDDWLEAVGAMVIEEDEIVSVAEVMRRYEAAEPPFCSVGNKKHEFPDAVALLTLSGWAQLTGTKLLVVTQDNDWKNYGAESEHLVVVNDLADALAGLQRLAEATEVAQRLAGTLADGDPLRLRDSLLEALQYRDDCIQFNIEADSQFSFDLDDVDPEFNNIEFCNPDDTNNGFKTISYRDGVATIKVTAAATVSVEVYYSFDKWDSIDREYFSMGSTTLSHDEEIEFEALIAVAVDSLGVMSIEQVEILPAKYDIYFGEIEPDWMNEPDDDDR